MITVSNNILTNIVILSLATSFVVMLIDKVGIVEHMQIHGVKIVSKLFNCNFCICFWTSILLSGIYYIFVSRNIECLLYPLLITPLVRQLI